MSVPVSETYIEEIHITKINIGDSVEITVDALPEKSYHGVIYKIANIGQELAGFDSKVFQVLTEIKDSDKELKPAMTTNNNIVMSSVPDVLTIPRESLYSENGDYFVYMKRAGDIIKKKVITGLENETKVIIESGLEEKDKILLTAPEDAKEIEYQEDIALK